MNSRAQGGARLSPEDCIGFVPPSSDLPAGAIPSPSDPRATSAPSRSRATSDLRSGRRPPFSLSHWVLALDGLPRLPASLPARRGYPSTRAVETFVGSTSK